MIFIKSLLNKQIIIDKNTNEAANFKENYNLKGIIFMINSILGAVGNH
jgi:hypothetical protein